MFTSTPKTVINNDALLVEDLGTTLLSVAKIADRNNTVFFYKTEAVIRYEDGKINLGAKLIGNFY